MTVSGRIRLRVLLRALACIALALGAWAVAIVRQAQAAESYAIAMHGAPALPADFPHMPYANPDAPKGGRLAWGLLGTFDSLNPLIVRGLAVQQIRGFVVESLMARGNDEAFTLYGLLARTVETDDARSYVTFHLDPRARFADGKQVTADDVLFSWALLRDRGRPNHRQYYSKVAKAEATDPLTVRFDFGGANDRELPLILGLMPVLPRHAVDPATFEETTMTGPLGSGPYRVTAVKPGASVTLTRNPDYWGRDLPVNRGLWNFDEIRLDFYRESNGQFEAFKRGLYDFRVEHEPLRWHDGYDFPAARNGELIRETIKTGMPQPSEFLVFNTRRPVFSDIRVRQALTLLFDFEWINRNYFFGLYARSASFFAGSELSAYARPADERERELLKPFAAQIPPDILDGSYRLPVTDGSGRDRATLRSALTLLSAGRLRSRWNRAAATFDQDAPHLRNPGDDARSGADRAGLSARPQARRDRSQRARGRSRPVRPAPARLRVRHAAEPLGSVAVPRQRAILLLGQPGRRHSRHAKLHGGEGAGDRRPDRGASGSARASGFRFRGTGAGPRPDVGFLCYPGV